MTIVERIKELCEAQCLTLASLERKLDFGNGTIRRWDNTLPSGDKLLKVAEYFNVSVDFLLGKKSDDEDVPDENFAIICRNAKKLSPEQRQKLLEMARVMFEGEFKE